MGILSNAKDANPSKTVRGVLFTQEQKKVSVQGSKRETLTEQKLHSLPKTPTFSGIDDVAVAKAEKFGVKQVGANPFQTPKLDSSVNSFMTGLQTKQSGVKPVQAGTIAAAKAAELPKTSIDQRLHIGGEALKDDSRSYIGMNLVPAYKEDDPLTKAGKGIVNYGVGGALSLASNIGGAAQQGIMQATRAGVNAIQGKPQDFREMSFGKDILGAKEDNLLTQAAATVLDPATYIGGGIVDDLSRAGFMGKASRPSTEMVQVLGESQQKLLAKMRGALSGVSSIADEAIPLEKVNTVKPSTLDGKFKIKNSAYDDVVKEYNDAIETIQNHFRTNELRTNEIPLIKSELGIDLDDIINRMEIAEKGVQLPGTDTMRLKRAAGAASDRTYKLADDVRLQGVGNKVDDVNPLGGKLPKAEPKPIGGELPKAVNKVVMDTPKEKFSFKKSWDKFYRSTVDNQAPIGGFSKKAGDDTAMLASNSRNAGGTVDYILKDALVDRKGNKIGASLREVAEQIPKGKEEDFWTYMSQRHNIDRAREGKHVIPNYTPEMSAQAVREIEALNPAYKAIGDDVTNWIDSFMKEWGVNAGTVDSEVYDNLRQTYKSYFPTQREFSQLEKSMPDSVRKQFVDSLTPIKKAVGSERDINNPLENIMNLVNRNVKTARYNEVGQSLLDSVRTAPDKLKEFAEVIPTKEGMFANTDNVISVLEGGKPVYLQINNKELLDAMKGLPKVVNNAKAMRAFTNVFKGLITQKNPLFAIRNIARDVPTAYVYGSTKNPLKFGAGLVKAGKDILTNSDNFQRYKAVGGGGGNFFKGDAVKSAKELTKKGFHPLKAIETFNNITETAPRLAEFNRIFDKTGDVQKALAAANDVTVNFARGGNVTKSMEPFVPYLNAGVQGLDKFFGGFKDPKTAVSTLIKGGVAITAPEIALYMINKDDPAYQELDNRTKDTYFLISKGDGTFWKIPKSRELGVLFGSLFQRAMRASEGDKEAYKGFFAGDGNPLKGTLLTNFAPSNPLENNIASPLFNLKSNKDFADRSIVPQGMIMDKRSPYLQYDERTSEIAKAIGNVSNVSPKQIDYLIRSYTGVIGQLGIPATTKGGSVGKTISTQFTSDPLYSSQTLTNFYDNYDRLQTEATDRNIVDELPTNGKENVVTEEEKLRNEFKKASAEISKINKEIKQIETALDPFKESKVRKLRQQIQDIAKAANDSLK